jgi:8-oxo-dGTP pyrophosphatase MutT (NUDIX family)
MEVYDPGREITLHLPVGGGVEFREPIYDAAKRELQEELGITSKLEYCSFSENFFEFDGIPTHEIVFHFLARIDDDTRRSLPEHGTESDGVPFPIRWYSVKELYEIREFVVPESVFDEIVGGLT